MTPFALRLCFFDPDREAPEYGGERATFVVMADDLSTAVTQWLTRADSKGVVLHVVEEAGPVTGDDLAELVEAAGETGLAVGQSYGYAPLEEPKGVAFGLIGDDATLTEVGAKAANLGGSLAAILSSCAQDGRALTRIDGLCDLAQTSEDAQFNGQDLPLAALSIGMQAPGTVVFGADYALGET